MQDPRGTDAANLDGGSRRAIRVGVATIAIFFGAFGAWAALAPLDGTVVGAGILTVHGKRKTVQHREGGIIADLLVQDGDHVAEGQVLIRLDATQVLAMMHVHEAEMQGDQALMARDLAEVAEANTVVFPTDVSGAGPVGQSVMAREFTVFRHHRTLLDQQLRVMDERIAQARQQGDGADAQALASQRGFAFAQAQLASLQELERSGLAGRNHVLELARTVEALRGEGGELQAEIAKHRAEVAEFEAEKLRLRSEAQSDATRELREAQLRVNDVAPRLIVDRDLLSHMDIRAPVAGEVVDLQNFTKGGVIEAGHPILDIVPQTPTIVAEAEIRPEDIEHLHVGQAARVIATGFNPRDTAPIEGRVAVISADRITDPHTGRSVFKAEITLLADHAQGALLARLDPGMPVEVVVPVAPRTALDYLTEPLRTSLRHAGREL